MSNQTVNASTIECDDDSNSASHQNELNASQQQPQQHQQQSQPIVIGTLKSTAARLNYQPCDDIIAQTQSISPQQQQQQPQQRVHVIKDGRFFYEEPLPIANATTQQLSRTSNNLAIIDSKTSTQMPPPQSVGTELPLTKQRIILNRQIIVQPNANGSTSTNSGVHGDQQSIDDIHFSARAKKLTALNGQGSSSNSMSATTNAGDTVNVVFRAPIVSSSSNQPMRPPPPPPPKIKGVPSEEPSSSIPDLGESINYFLFLVFLLNIYFPIYGKWMEEKSTKFSKEISFDYYFKFNFLMKIFKEISLLCITLRDFENFKIPCKCKCKKRRYMEK